ncbi:GNAT family N-acetyltransferase [Nocardioides sp. GCM10027113]|uniref:GNAT family N-acetyltransferase n=1 Tax=unclassified Nocardioides TaxID=2615069 RepID=UPI003619308D
MQQPSEAHRLGPHVVGQRVVVRRLLRGQTGPSGGPAMTDLLGICTAWGDGRCVVVPESGEPVEIALADIVSGKPVPPRPSVRHRVSVRDAEEHTLHLFPLSGPGALETERLGEWVLRTQPVLVERLVKRANSALAIADPGVGVDEALERVVDFYSSRGRPVLVQVEADSDVEASLVSRGWSVVAGGDADFLLGSLPRALRAARRDVPAAQPTEVELVETHSGAQPTSVELVETPAVNRATVTLTRNGREVARGEAALHDDWLGLHGLVVDDAHRRQGLGTAIVAELLDWGGEHGATTAWLHVETANTAGHALYERLGLTRHHGCRYLAPPT